MSTEITIFDQQAPHQPEHCDQIPDLWDRAAEYAASAARFAHASLACQIMTGFTLLELRGLYGRRPGRPAQDSSNDFEAHLDIHLGISSTTAWRWMKMAQGVKPRLKRLGDSDRLRELISTNPSTWSDSDVSAVEAAVKNITDGRTQADFLAELGLTKKSSPPPRREHNPSTPPDPSAPSNPSDQKSPISSIAIRDWGHIERLIAAYDAAAMFSHLDPALIQAQCSALESALQNRRSFLAGQ